MLILVFFYFSFQFSQFLLPCVFEALLWDVYTLRMVMSSWQINPFLIMEWPSLSPSVFFVLKFTLLNINNASFFTISVRVAYLCFPPGEWQFSPSFCMLCSFGLYPEHFECFVVRLYILFKSRVECGCVCFSRHWPSWVQGVCSKWPSAGRGFGVGSVFITFAMLFATGGCLERGQWSVL